MTIKTVLTCPLGSKCEEIRDNAIHRCAWNIEMTGSDPSTGDPKNERACAMAWMPILLVENSRQQVRTTSAVESFRNESAAATEGAQKFLMVAAALQRAPASQQLPAGAEQTLIGGG